MIACLVTTHNRPDALRRSLLQIMRLNAPALVVDDGSSELNAGQNRQICTDINALYLYLPQNRGLGCGLNCGLNFWLADKSVSAVSYIQDDCDCHPRLLEIMSKLQKYSPIITGHDARAHKSHAEAVLDGIPVKWKATSAGCHLHCSVGFWRGLLPFPTNSLGSPKRIPGRTTRGMGSDCDWWAVRDSPRSSKALGLQILCAPNLVRTFNWRPEDSCWGNSQPWGEEAPLTTLW